jgi:hypothetical protein
MHVSRADLSQAFCSYYGYPPMGRWRRLAHRVCMRCERATSRLGRSSQLRVVDSETASVAPS